MSYILEEFGEDIENGEDDTLEFGCLFPEKCCMPGHHFKAECFTPEMAEEYLKEATFPAPTGEQNG